MDFWGHSAGPIKTGWFLWVPSPTLLGKTALSTHNWWTQLFPFGRAFSFAWSLLLEFNSQFLDPTGLGCALHEVRNTGEECVWQSPGQLSNVYSVGGWDAHSCWQRSTSRRNIPALSGMGDWLWNVKGERHPTKVWVQLTDPSERDPGLQCQRPRWGKLSLWLPRRPHLPSSSHWVILVMLSGLTLLFCLSSIFLSQENPVLF